MLPLLWLAVALPFTAMLVSIWLSHRKLAAASGWPTTEGKIVEAAIRENGGNGTWTPEISYAYVVAGKGYASDRLRPGGTPFFYRKARAFAIAAAYPVGSEVVVHHDPKKPGRAAINLTKHSNAVLLFGILTGAMLAVALLVTLL